MTAVDRLRGAGRRTLAVAALATSVAATAACRGAASPSATPAGGVADAGPPGTPTALALRDYRDRVATAAAVLAAAPTGRSPHASAGARVKARATALALVGRPLSVTLRAGVPASGRRAIAGNDPSRDLVAAPLVLAATTPSASDTDVVARLAVVRDEVDASRDDGTAAQVAALERVLADPAFRDPRSLWQQSWDWLKERFDRWWGGRSLPSGTGEAALRLGQIVGWAVALAVILAVGLWTARLLTRLTDGARIAPQPDAPPSTPAEARARAEADAGTGDYRSAVRQLYLAALLVLESNGLLRADRSRTNREQLAALTGGDGLRAHMATVVDTFDRVWYGVTVPDRATFRAYSDDVRQLEALATRAPGASSRPTADSAPPGAGAGGGPDG